jgi:hypothetical protein
MKIQDRKLLIKFLGECPLRFDLDKNYYQCECGFFTKIGEEAIAHRAKDRTFLTWQD